MEAQAMVVAVELESMVGLRLYTEGGPKVFSCVKM